MKPLICILLLTGCQLQGPTPETRIARAAPVNGRGNPVGCEQFASELLPLFPKSANARMLKYRYEDHDIVREHHVVLFRSRGRLYGVDQMSDGARWLPELSDLELACLWRGVDGLGPVMVLP